MARGTRIVDEFTNLELSTFQKYYLRQKRDKKCVMCGIADSKDKVRCSKCQEFIGEKRKGEKGFN